MKWTPSPHTMDAWNYAACINVRKGSQHKHTFYYLSQWSVIRSTGIQNLTEHAEELHWKTTHFKLDALVRGIWQVMERRFCNYGSRADSCRETEIVAFIVSQASLSRLLSESTWFRLMEAKTGQQKQRGWNTIHSEMFNHMQDKLVVLDHWQKLWRILLHFP